ncbi:MAG: glycosyltransferase [Rhodobacteraceae bacterium]|nr:glycosyltransferase [Paracoccaceae bacterium]
MAAQPSNIDTDDAGPNRRGKPRLLYLSTDLTSFLSHKKPVADAAVQAGYDVIVAGSWPGPAFVPGQYEFEIVEIDWRRAPTMFAALLRVVPDILRVRRLLRVLRPDLLHNIDLKPAIIGSLAAGGLPVKIVNSINGLGFAFVDTSLLSRLVRWGCGLVLRRAQWASAAATVVQNKDDAAVLSEKLGLAVETIHVIRGSGVDPRDFDVAPIPDGPPNFLVLSRLLHIKGIHVAVEALRRVRARGTPATLTIAGAPDPGNPSSVDAATLARWSSADGVTLTGQVADVRPLIARSLAVIQPSLGGEGLPKSLLEAAAGGRALIATDVPGNREIVVDGQTGLSVPPDDAEALSAAMEAAAARPETCRKWGLAAREKAAAEFATSLICRQHLALYRRIVALDSRG